MDRIDNRIKIVKDEILNIGADAIVNSTDEFFSGSSGLDKFIHKKAGEKLEKKLSKINSCEIGECIITKGYNLPVKNIIHTITPKWNGGYNDENKLLYSCYKNSIELAIEYGNKTIAIPSISSGDNKFPIDDSANIAYYTAWRMIKKYSKDDLLMIYFSCTNKNIYDKYKQLSQDYQDIEFSQEMLKQYKKANKYSNKNIDTKDFIVNLGIESAYSIFLLKEAFLQGQINLDYVSDTVKVLKEIFLHIKNMTKNFNIKIYKDELDRVDSILKEIYSTLDYEIIETTEAMTKYYFPHANDYLFDKVNNYLKY